MPIIESTYGLHFFYKFSLLLYISQNCLTLSTDFCSNVVKVETERISIGVLANRIKINGHRTIGRTAEGLDKKKSKLGRQGFAC